MHILRTLWDIVQVVDEHPDNSGMFAAFKTTESGSASVVHDVWLRSYVMEKPPASTSE